MRAPTTWGARALAITLGFGLGALAAHGQDDPAAPPPASDAPAASAPADDATAPAPDPDPDPAAPDAAPAPASEPGGDPAGEAAPAPDDAGAAGTAPQPAEGGEAVTEGSGDGAGEGAGASGDAAAGSDASADTDAAAGTSGDADPLADEESKSPYEEGRIRLDLDLTIDFQQIDADGIDQDFTNVIVKLGVGYYLTDSFELKGTFSTLAIFADDVEIGLFGFAIEPTLYFPDEDAKIVPFIGAIAGFGIQLVDVAGENETDFLFQIGAKLGVDYVLTENAVLKFQCGLTFYTGADVDILSNRFLIGFSYFF